MADETGPVATTEPATTTTTVTEPATTEPLGDGGKAALEAERKARKSAEKAARDVQAKLDELTAASQSETEKQIAKARKESAEAATAEVTNAYRSKLLNAEVRAQAAGKFANPALAAKVLDIDLDAAFVDDELDTASITRAIDEFLALDENTGLRAGGTAARPQGTVNGGEGEGGGDQGFNARLRKAAGF
jgi:hypothetical protein